MNKYKIASSDGGDYGIWYGINEADVFSQLCREAGYDVICDQNGKVIYKDDETQKICGDIENWQIWEY